jgi:membrane associated rhomboid family serine protease
MKVTINAVNGLIAINIAMYALAFIFSSPDSALDLYRAFALHYPANEAFYIWQPVTYLFLHGNFAHILFNMYALFAFGRVLEQCWGTKKFLIFYFVSGVGAALIYTLVNAIQYNAIVDELARLGLSVQTVQDIVSGQDQSRVLSELGEQRLHEYYSLYYSSAVGASGAIYGILIAFALIFPQAKLFLIFLPIPIKAKLFVPALIGVDFFFGVTSYSIGNVAHFAHIGGAIFGLLMILWWRYTRSKNSQQF